MRAPQSFSRAPAVCLLRPPPVSAVRSHPAEQSREHKGNQTGARASGTDPSAKAPHKTFRPADFACHGLEPRVKEKSTSRILQQSLQGFSWWASFFGGRGRELNRAPAALPPDAFTGFLPHPSVPISTPVVVVDQGENAQEGRWLASVETLPDDPGAESVPALICLSAFPCKMGVGQGWPTGEGGLACQPRARASTRSVHSVNIS